MAHTHGHNGNGTCVECATPQLARNNYFTGKLLVERDFREEQDYFLGKDRRHNQELHGWGVVCGLKVKQHPDENCRDRYVIVEPAPARMASEAVPTAPSPPDPVFTPRNGQSATQTEGDRQACNRFAVTQQSAMADAGVFHHTVLACMESRGYSVR